MKKGSFLFCPLCSDEFFGLRIDLSTQNSSCFPAASWHHFATGIDRPAATTPDADLDGFCFAVVLQHPAGQSSNDPCAGKVSRA